MLDLFPVLPRQVLNKLRGRINYMNFMAFYVA